MNIFEQLFSEIAAGSYHQAACMMTVMLSEIQAAGQQYLDNGAAVVDVSADGRTLYVVTAPGNGPHHVETINAATGFYERFVFKLAVKYAAMRRETGQED